MPLSEVHPFLFVWIGIGAIGSLWLLIHPSSWRAFYIGWRGAWGLVVDPKSPILSNTALRLYGVFLAIFVSVGAYIFIGQEAARWEEEQKQQERDPHQVLDDLMESFRNNHPDDHAQE